MRHRVSNGLPVLVAVGVIASLTLAGPTASAGPAPATPVKGVLVLDRPSPPKVFEDDPVRLTGKLLSGKTDRRVFVESRREGFGWHRVASTRTDATGRFSTSFTPENPGPQTLRAVHPQKHGLLYSADRSLLVLDRYVTLTTRPSYNTFTTIAVTGRVRPPAAGRHVVIQHRSDGKWIDGADGYTTAAGTYTIEMRNDTPGLWTVRAYWAGAHPQGGTGEWSAVHQYHVHAVLHPMVYTVTRKQLGGSYHDGCPVGPTQLRAVAMTYHTFGPLVGRGRLVVRTSIVDRTKEIFATALAHGYPIRRMLPTAHYGGSDVKSMNHDNTSAFNCRHVTGDPTHLSPHSYGNAIDVDTVENPYQDIHGTWWPKNIGQQFRDRSHPHPGMLYSDSTVTNAFTSRGFRWGGVWSHPDYQHFDTDTGSPRHRGGPVAGPLSAASLPRPGALGAGWRSVGPSGTPDAASGTTALPYRRPAESAGQEVRPIGCSTLAPTRGLPAPHFALQASYRRTDGAPAQAVALRFGSTAAAAAYFAALRQALLECRLADGPAGMFATTTSSTATSYVGTRTYLPGETWHEVDFVTGAQVTVVLAKAPLPGARSVLVAAY